MHRRRRSFALAAALFALAGCRSRESGQAQADSSQPRQQEPMAPPLRLTMGNGQMFDLAEQRGKVVAIFFGYTHCPDFCPTTMADFATVKRRLRERSDQVRFVFVTVDPKRDTPERAESYARGFDRSFIGLSGDSATLVELQRGFHVASFIEPDSSGGSNYTVGHSALVFVVGKNGRIVNTLLPGSGRAEWLYSTLNEAIGTGG